MNEIKYCEDCKHSTARMNGMSLRCANPDFAGAVSLVYRKPDPEDLPHCVLVRSNGIQCGSSGMFFEPRPPDPLRKWWKIWG